MKTCLFYLLLMTSPWILAQEDESGITDTEETAEQVETTTDESNDEEPVENEDEDDVDFVPTVQISEDLSVAFPVDI